MINRISILALLLGALLVLPLSCSKDSGNESNSSSDDTTKTITDENGEDQEVNISENKKLVGDSANDILSDASYESIIFEIFYVTGFEPNQNTVANFESFLENRLNKPEGITIELKEIESPGQDAYSVEDIAALEDTIRTEYNQNGRLAVSGIFLDGEYSENTENGSVLGIAYRNTSFVIFEETVQSFSGQAFGPSLTVLESTVLNHEFGHLMGMVNAGTPMQTEHQDTEHGRHCTDDSCLMYWTAETGEGLLNMLSGGMIPDFDSQCLADLQANGGK